jgi:molecular chaperone GrpE
MVKLGEYLKEVTMLAAQEKEEMIPSHDQNNSQEDEATYTGEATTENTSGETSEIQVEDLIRQITELNNQLEEANQRTIRAQADFDNFRRRTRQEKEDFAKYASQKLIEQLIPVVDNFNRAMQATQSNKDFESLAKGVDMIYRQLDQVLSNEGLQRMETIGQPFNPELHQAIMQVESEEHEEGTIVEELQSGYMLKDRVIRPAMVKVSK